MLTIIYDRNYRRDTEREATWEVGQPLPDIAPHRIIELHADGKEKEHIEGDVGGFGNKDYVAFYGDLARTVYLNIDDGGDDK